MNKDKLIQIGQWLVIILLSIACFYFWGESKIKQDNLVENGQYKKNDTQDVIITGDKTLKELKKTNEELYDSIKKLTNVAEAIQIKYITKYKTDTVFIGDLYSTSDTIYHYSQTSDTINYDLDIKAKSVEWFKLGFSVRDSLMIVRRSSNGQNETTITHPTNTTITDVTVFTPKKTSLEKIKERTYFGVGVGAGYGIFNKKPDIYLGVNIGIKF